MDDPKIFLAISLPRHRVTLPELIEAITAQIVQGVRPQAGSFYDRLLAEHTELQTRHQKLGEFVDSPAFGDLDEQQRELLIGQYEAMRVYSEILGERIRTIAPPESRTTARHSDKPDEIIGEGVRMIGGDQSEKPVPFEG